MDWAPLTAALLSPGPGTDTIVALADVHEIDVVPGSASDDGFAAIEAVTAAAAVTFTVAVWVTGPPGPCAVIT